MSREFEECLTRNKISAFPRGPKFVLKELTAARADWADGMFGLVHNKYKWSTIQGYYSMYHTARALIFSRGYRDRSHYCLMVALKALFVMEGKLSVERIQEFHEAMKLREDADYNNLFSQKGAASVLDRASSFLEEVEGVLNLREHKKKG